MDKPWRKKASTMAHSQLDIESVGQNELNVLPEVIVLENHLPHGS
jgi:hypothetical protein